MNNDRGCKVTPQMIFMVKSHINSQIHYCHKNEIADSRNMRICNSTKLEVLNPDLWSEIYVKKFSKISKMRLLVEKVYFRAAKR